MTAFVPESIHVLGTDGGGLSVVLCEMYVDTIADLPAPNAFTGFRLSMGCVATVINDNSRHRINSAGQWVQISAGTSTYTRAEIDNMISAIDSELQTKITIVDVFGTGILIPDSSDINDYTIGGKYYGGNSAGNTVLNLPVPNGNFNFTMTVTQVTPSATIQKLKICNIANDPYIYFRRRTSTTWQSWYRFDGVQV